MIIFGGSRTSAWWEACRLQISLYCKKPADESICEVIAKDWRILEPVVRQLAADKKRPRELKKD